MRTSLVALAASSLIAITAWAGVTPATAAAPVAGATGCRTPTAIVGSTVSPRTVVLGVSQPQGVVLTAKIRSNGCHVKRVEMGLYGPNFIDTFDLDRVGTSNGVTTYDTGLRITPGALPNSEAGRWASYVSVWGERQPNSPGPDWRILRAARLTTNAAPEPVKKGKALTVTGSLQRADWETRTYRGYGQRRVQLQWRSSGGVYRVVKNVTTDKRGRLTTKVTAAKDGCFRFVFPGSSTTAPVRSSGDCVDVR